MAEILKNWFAVLFGAIIWGLIFISENFADDVEQQYFRVYPRNVEAQEGSEVTLTCEIEYRSGLVQWTKDGYALGSEYNIPGFSRYHIIGDRLNGVFNLHIQNVNLSDDAEFECQVGPSRKASRKITEIRAKANLTVLSPPESVEIVGYTNMDQVEVQEYQDVRLECHVRRSKPAARIVWYRGTEELKLGPGNRNDRTVESVDGRPKPEIVDDSNRLKYYDVLSTINFSPTADDDDTKYSCEAQHDALPNDMYLRKSVMLSVLYPPGDPVIEGYKPDTDVIRRGQYVELQCRSRGGNPLAQLVWYRNGEEVRAVSSLSGKHDKTSENILSFVADTKDNKAKYTCKASSVVGPTQKKAEVVLVVNYAPLYVKINGPTEARKGDTVLLNCTTGASNPAASIKWLIDGRQVASNNSRILQDPENGWLTSSSISITIEEKSIVFICQAVNALLDEKVVDTRTINVLHPPGLPVISGYESGTFIDAGTLQHLTCKSYGGNPSPTLTWFKNDKKVQSVTKSEKAYVYSELHVLVNASDNEAIYRCEASNSAVDIPAFTFVKMNVYFPPETVILKKDPTEFRVGSVGRFICNASSSNPEANVTLWRDGIEIENVVRQSKAGLYGGEATSIVATLNITADMDGNLFTCQAQNPKLGRRVDADLRLEVMDKPTFVEYNDTTFVGVEGETLIVSLEANGHPSSITYTWSKNGISLLRGPNYISEGPRLNFTKLNRTDSGSYSCKASNSEGEAIINFTINVQYAASIKNISDVVMVNENEDAELWCTISALPSSAEFVTWRREGLLPDSRASSTFKNDTLYLTLRGVTKKDMGEFLCVADNGLGIETNRTAYLVVKHKPEINQSSLFAKAAARKDDTARLICRASGAPRVAFAWSQNGHAISVNTTAKYHANFNQLDAITYESVLSIHKIEKKDYGVYQCKASNALGFVVTSVNLTAPSRPDPPMEMRVVNATHDTITISWKPGFDGGETAKFRIRYRDANVQTANFKYTNADHNTMYTISGLQLGTYVFSVLAYNKIGESEYVNNMLKASTSSEASPSLSETSMGSKIQHLPKMYVVAGVAAVILVLVINVALCVCFAKKYRKRRDAPAKALLNNAELPLVMIFSVAVIGVLLLLINICILTALFYKRKNLQGRTEPKKGKSGIEMYAPSSFNETVSGETLSSVSEKSETYSDPRQDYDDKKRNTVNGYLIEQIDYPFQHPGYDSHPKEYTNSIGHHRNPYMTHNNCIGYQSETSSRHSSSSDPRYVTYPPPILYAPPSIGNGTLRRGAVPPPDVTVLTMPPPSLSTFNHYGTTRTDGHLV